MDSRARITIESKDDMRKRRLPSPDRADTAAMLFSGRAQPPFLDWPSERVSLWRRFAADCRLGVSGEHLPLPAEDLVDKDDRIWVIGDDAGLSALVEQCMTRLH